MIPIYEQGDGRGIGHGLDSFLNRFDEICADHLENNRAKAFAFIFYDFTNDALRRILRDQGVFAKLDRISGKDLSLFYLHTADPRAVKTFNHAFLSRLGLDDSVEPPCVVFFRFDRTLLGMGERGFSDIAVAQLDNANLIHGFHELLGIVEGYTGRATKGTSLTFLRWITSSTKFVGTEIFRAALRNALSSWL